MIIYYSFLTLQDVDITDKDFIDFAINLLYKKHIVDKDNMIF